MSTTADKKFLHELHEKYYGSGTKVKDLILDAMGKAECMGCGKRKKLRKIGKNKGRCARCKKL